MTLATPPNANSNSAIDDQKSWNRAKDLSEKLGRIPTSFTECIRALVYDHQKNQRILRPSTKYLAVRLLRSPSFKAMLYFASADLHADYIEGRETYTIGDLVDLYQPLDLAVMIMTYLLYRKNKKAVNPAFWSDIEVGLTVESQLGCLIGAAIPEIGLSTGIVLGTLPHLSLAILVNDNPIPYGQYRQHLEAKKVRVDSPFEISLWGTSSAKVTSMILSRFGFGIDMSQSLSGAFEASNIRSKGEDELPQRATMALIWLEALSRGATQPSQSLPAKFYPAGIKVPYLAKTVPKILGGSKHWLDRSKQDLNATLAPGLFAENRGSNEVPGELREIFSLKEITSMEEEDFDNLVDRIDYENEHGQPLSDDELSAEELEALEKMVDN